LGSAPWGASGPQQGNRPTQSRFAGPSPNLLPACLSGLRRYGGRIMSATPRRSLESLKKEAKHWLRELHAGDATALARLSRALPDRTSGAATLREVQHALARELGYEGWSALKSHAEAAGWTPALSLAQYEVMVEALLEAFHRGTPEAMERHYQYTWHRR